MTIVMTSIITAEYDLTRLNEHHRFQEGILSNQVAAYFDIMAFD